MDKGRDAAGEDEDEDIEIVVNVPNGGWGWIVVICSFGCNMIVDGIQYTFGNFIAPISDTFGASVSQVTLIGSLLTGFYNFCGPFASALGNKFGFRTVAMIGSIISSAGLGISYFAESPLQLYFSYGILGGFGFGMVYMSTVIITSVYFDRLRAIAVSIAVCGTGVGTFAFAPFAQYMCDNKGWRLTLAFEAAIVLLCILFAITFRPLEKIIARGAKDTTELSISSMVTLGNKGPKSKVDIGSALAFADAIKSSYNPNYPTLKQGLQMQGDDRKPASSAPPGASLVVLPRKSMVSEREIGIKSGRSRRYTDTEDEEGNESVRQKNRCQRCCMRFNWKCTTCCCNFLQCRRHRKTELTVGARPMYRDDVFYEGSLARLPNYSPDDPTSYHLSVTRLPNEKDVVQEVEPRCCECHEAVKRTLVTMLGLNLFKEGTFILYCLSCFFYTMGMLIPFMFIKQYALQVGIEESLAVWLISAIGIANTFGRLTSGIVSTFTSINAPFTVFFCLVVSGVSTALSFLLEEKILLFSYCCVFGFFTAPAVSLRPIVLVEFLGMERLTNAFGLVLLTQGVAATIGTPVAGCIYEATGTLTYPFILAGSLISASAVAIGLACLIHNRNKKEEIQV